MKSTIRTFIAIKIRPGKKLLEIIHRFQKSFSEENIRWVPHDNLHITLRFLGETTKEQVSEIVEFMESLSENFSGFQFELSGIGYFKRKKTPRVLFANAAKNERLKLLAQNIETKMVSLGFKKSEHEFTPHLTIARFKYVEDKEKFFFLTDKYADSAIQQVNVSEIIFYQSILSAEGPTYVPIKTIKLKN